MTEYEYERQKFTPGEGEIVEVPDDAIGVTTDTLGNPQKVGFVVVRYLIPIDA